MRSPRSRETNARKRARQAEPPAPPLKTDLLWWRRRFRLCLTVGQTIGFRRLLLAGSKKQAALQAAGPAESGSAGRIACPTKHAFSWGFAGRIPTDHKKRWSAPGAASRVDSQLSTYPTSPSPHVPPRRWRPTDECRRPSAGPGKWGARPWRGNGPVPCPAR